MKTPEFWYRDDGSSLALAVALTPISWIYQAVTKARLAFTRPYIMPIPVICVGNLVMGGAGKTPTVIMIASLLKEWGYKPHIISRGYSGNLGHLVIEVNPFMHSADEVGDEPLLLAQYAPTWVGINRVACAKAAHQKGADVILMDDGFQNPSLLKDLSIVVVDGKQRFGNKSVFPAGPLRESVASGLKRADAVITVGHCPLPCPAFRVNVESSSVMPQTPLVAFAGIGYPEKFYQTLLENGANVEVFIPFDDHHLYTNDDMKRLDKYAQSHNGILMTTTKDYIRIPLDWREKVRVWEIEFVPGEEFKKWLGLWLEGARE